MLHKVVYTNYKSAMTILTRMTDVDLLDVVYDVMDEIAREKPAKISLGLHFLKWQEAVSYPSDSIYKEAAEDVIISHTLEQFRRQILAVDQTIDDYFSDNNFEDDQFYMCFLGEKTSLPFKSSFIEDYIRDLLLTPKVLAFYNTYVEVLKEIQSTLLLRGIFTKGLDKQDDARKFLYSNLSYDNREYLLFWSGVIDDDLRSSMSRIRLRRNNLVHSTEAGLADETEHAVNDLDLCIDVMQEICDIDGRNTVLGNLDSIYEVTEESNNWYSIGWGPKYRLAGGYSSLSKQSPWYMNKTDIYSVIT